MLLNEKLRGLPPTDGRKLGNIRALWARFVAVVAVKCRTAAPALKNFLSKHLGTADPIAVAYLLVYTPLI